MPALRFAKPIDALRSESPADQYTGRLWLCDKVRLLVRIGMARDVIPTPDQSGKPWEALKSEICMWLLVNPALACCWGPFI